MASPQDSPRQRRGVRSYFRELVRSHSRSPSHQPAAVALSSSGANLTSPAPSQGSSSTIGNLLAPPSSYRRELRHARSDSQLTQNSIPVIQVGSGGTIWTGLRAALEELGGASGMFPPLRSAIGSLISCLGLLETMSKSLSEYEEIASELKGLSESLTRHMKDSSSIRMSNCIANFALGIEQQAKLINAKSSRGSISRIAEASIEEEELTRCYRKIDWLFRQLQTDANLSTWSIANEVLANTRLEGLAPAKLANYDSKLSTEISRRNCTEGTRTAVLSQLDDWSLDLNAPDLYLMSGMAGTGKTTIACSFANKLEERKQLAASFFCTRMSPECRDINRIVPTIAYQLARYSTPFQSALCEVLGHDPDIGSKNIVKQFDRLLGDPLLKVKDAIPDNLVVVIDALDECEDRRGMKLVLELLFKFASGLPLKFFVTSRPEPELYEKMASYSPTLRTVFYLHEIEKSLVQADIELYLNEELQSVSPTTSQVQQLAQRSGSLFIYAATLVRYIQLGRQSSNARKRLHSILAMIPEAPQHHAEIDALYTAVLRSALDEDCLDSEEANDVRLVLRAALCVQEPVQVETLAALTGINDVERALSALQLLRSVIHFSENSGLVSTLHASFPDFMFSKERSGTFFFDVAQHNQLLVRQCFIEMKQLRFNICGLESSFLPDTQVEDLGKRIERAISSTLSYACQYWGDHLRLAMNSDELCMLLSDFLSNRLLFWMEVLNLKQMIGVGPEILAKVKLWLQASTKHPDLVRFTEDAQTFVMSYAANAVVQCTPHIYISSLPLCPRSSLVFKNYWSRTRGLMELKGTGLERREVAALASWEFEWSVLSIAYSPDGSYIGFGCSDGMVGIRNAYDGSLIAGPFKAHTGRIYCIAFSPDSLRLVTASDDCTLRVWNILDGAPLDYIQHISPITSAAFSPNGLRIIFGSTDHSIRFWDVGDSTPLAGPLKGHTGTVRSVALSSDGTRIVSGSEDCTIQVWNQDGTLACHTLKGHTGTVWSVAFSPDNTRIASGSSDRTIRIWKSQDGTPIAGPLWGHADHIYSVAFSPDSTRVVSGSRDNSIRVWSSYDGTLVAGPFEDHTDTVWSVAVSPDGMRIISASGDSTIRVWDARTDRILAGQVEGHTDGIWSISFAPDGTRVASGSTDRTIRVWDARDGSPVAGPFKGRNGVIRSVAISPDSTHVAYGSDNRTAGIWHIRDSTLATGPLKGYSRSVRSVAFSHDGAWIATGSSDATIRIWRTLDGTLATKPFQGHTSSIMSIAISPDDQRIVSGSYDHTIRAWHAQDGTLLTGPFQGHTDWVMCVAFSPSGQHVVSGSKDCTICVWNPSNSNLVVGPFRGHTDVVRSAVYSPDGMWVASASDDRTIRLWDARNGAPIAGPFYGHTWRVNAVAFSPDGARLVSCSSDSTIRMWDIHRIRDALPTSNMNHTNAPTSISTDAHTHPITAFTNWRVDYDGWITDEKGHLLFWAPPEVLRSLMTPYCTFIIGRSGSIEIDLDLAFLGGRWHRCYPST